MIRNVTAGIALLAGVAVAALPVACGSAGGPPPADETPQQPETVDLLPSEPLDLGGDDVLIIETGCFQCDGPTEGLLRVYPKPDGAPVIDPLLAPADLSLGPRPITGESGVEEAEPVITGYVVSADTSEIWVSICVAETCGNGGALVAWSAGSRTALMRSTDGGVSWERAGTLESGGFVTKLLEPGRPLIGTWDADGAPPTFRTFPSLEVVEPPRPQAWPVAVRDGKIIWRSSQGGALIDGAGETIFDFGTGAFIGGVSAGAQEGGPSLLVLWSLSSGGPPYVVTELDAGGQPDATYRSATFLGVAPLGLEKGRAYGNAQFNTGRSESAYIPVVLNFAQGTMHPIFRPFASVDFPTGRNHVAGVTRGPFQRVASPDGCLPLRAEASASSPEVACAADGVLLRPTGDAVAAEGVTWQPVRAPDGNSGLVDSAFLTR